jgi:hypothetical protein
MRCADSLAAWIAGRSTAMRIPKTAIATRASTKEISRDGHPDDG